MAYSLCPDLNIRRLSVTSEYSMGRAPSVLSIVSVTSARPSGGREVVPANTTSSILPPRSDLAPCSPITQDKASRMLDLPEPFGPTTQVMPGSRRSVVAEAKDLKPRRVRLFRYTCQPLLSLPAPYRPAPSETANRGPKRTPILEQACQNDRMSLLGPPATASSRPAVMCGQTFDARVTNDI